jgi:hypothetical protein
LLREHAVEPRLDRVITRRTRGPDPFDVSVVGIIVVVALLAGMLVLFSWGG